MVGFRCAVGNCNNTSINCKNTDIRFHAFPRNLEMKKLWCKALGKPHDWLPSSTLQVCSAHFLSNCYGSVPKPGVRHKLKRSAIPNYAVPDINVKKAKVDKTLAGSSVYKKKILKKNVDVGTLDAHKNLPGSSSSSSDRFVIEHTYQTSSILPTNDKTESSTKADDEFSQTDDEKDIISSESCTEPQDADSSYSQSILGLYEPCYKLITPDIEEEKELVEEEDSEEDESAFPENTAPHLEDKFIVFASQLLLLFKFCRVSGCHKPIITTSRKIRGTFVSIKTECLDGHIDTWESQPMFGTTAWGNYLLAAAVYYSGVLPSKCLRALGHCNIKTFKIGMYFYYERMFQPVIEKLWKSESLGLLKEAKETPVPICGDSPGFSAEYGIYTFLNTLTSKILHIEIVQSAELSSSNQMELEGLKRGLAFFCEQKISISKLLSDMNGSITAYMRNSHPSIVHEFDTWHLAKNIKSKLEAIGKMEKFKEINTWIEDIINHIYFVAGSSTSKVERQSKWESLLNHVCDIHQGHSKEFPQCLHEPMDSKGNERVWIVKESDLYVEVSKVVKSPATLTAISNLSDDLPTYSLEVFHSVLNSFSPNMYRFTKDSMLSRIYLACLHYNENGKRDQEQTEDVREQYYIADPVAKVKAPTLNKDYDERTYKYVAKLIDLTYDQILSAPT